MIQYIAENPDAVASFIVVLFFPLAFLVICILKTTKWGKANGKVLEKILDILDDIDKDEAKKKISDLIQTLPDKEYDALSDKIRTRDPDMKTPTTAEIVKREVVDSVGGRRRRKRIEERLMIRRAMLDKDNNNKP